MRLVTDDLLVDGVRLAYLDQGEGEPVVLLHGTPAHSIIWRKVVPALRAAGHRVIAYDLLGYGASERPVGRDTSVTAQAALLPQLLAALGVARCTVAGHDIGGAIAQLVALDRPDLVRRLALLDTVSYDSWPSETWQRIIAAHPGGFGALPDAEYEALVRGQLAMTVTRPERMSGPVLASYLAPLRGTVERASFFAHQVAHYDSAPTRQAAGRLGELSMPVRLIWGAEDAWQPVSYAHRLAADIPHTQLRVIAGAGHFVTEDAPGQVAAELRDFLA
jgi:pimeloyl-ACP methyl ester carboxylesterase